MYVVRIQVPVFPEDSVNMHHGSVRGIRSCIRESNALASHGLHIQAREKAGVRNYYPQSGSRAHYPAALPQYTAAAIQSDVFEAMFGENTLNGLRR